MNDSLGKKMKVQIKFIDLDQNNRLISHIAEVIGQVGEPIDYNPQAEIQSLKEQGYALADNQFDNSKSVFDPKRTEYQIAFHHQKVVIDSRHPGFGFNASDLQKIVKQIVHYEGAAGRNPQDSVTTAVFNHVYLVDQVTKQTIEDRGFQPQQQSMQLIGTPTVPGYVPDQTIVGGKIVSASDDDQNYLVTFKLNLAPAKTIQCAYIRYVNLSNHNQILAEDKVSGNVNTPINYDPQIKISQFEQQGFKLVNNGFNPNHEVQFFGNQDGYCPVFIVSFNYEVVEVNSQHPLDGVDPNLYQKDSRLIVKFVGPNWEFPDQIQKRQWHRSITVNPRTRQLITNGKFDTAWSSDQDQYDAVVVPVVSNYHVDQPVVKVKNNIPKDQVVAIHYQANGRLIPVDEDGAEISNAPHPQFETDPNDASQVRDDQVVPDLAGFTSSTMTVAPTAPGEDYQIVYHKKQDDNTMYINLGSKDQSGVNTNTTDDTAEKISIDKATSTGKAQEDQIAVVNFIDIDHNSKLITSSGKLVGKAGESINDLYSTKIPLKVLKEHGYHVIFNSFDDQDKIRYFNENPLPQVFNVGISKKLHVEEKTEPSSVDTEQQKLEETRQRFNRIKPTLVDPRIGRADSQTVNKLLDIVAALLNLIFIINNKDDKK